jgi:hypothetical protein
LPPKVGPASDDMLIKPIADQVSEILERAALEISEIMRRGGEGVQVAHFMTAICWELSEKEVEEASARDEWPPGHMKFVSNMEGKSYLNLLADVAELLSNADSETTVTTVQ